MSLAILFHFLSAQHISDINIYIIRSLRLCCWITTSVVLFSVLCVLEILCGSFWVVIVLQASACKTITTQNHPYFFNIGPKFARKTKGLRVFKKRALTKSGAKKENNRTTVYNQKLHIFQTSPIIRTLKELNLFIRLLNKNDLYHPISVTLRFVSYASISISVNSANAGFT